MGRISRTLAVAALAIVALALPAMARDFTVASQGRLLAMQLGGHLVSVPGPLWGPAGETVPVEKSQIVYRQVAPGVESVLFLPLGQTLVTWTRMMGVLAVGRPGYKGATQVASIVEPLVKSCINGQALITRIAAVREGGREGLLLMCGRYSPTGDGPRNCAAGIIVAVVLQSDMGAMKVYHEWCTGTFDVSNRNTWPVPDAELEASARDLQEATTFTPLPLPGAASPGSARTWQGLWK